MARTTAGAGRSRTQVISMCSVPAQSLTFINAQMGSGETGSLRIVGSRIAALHEGPKAGDQILDLQGDWILPGLINAHDHLQLNSLPALESDKQYRHVRAWIRDVDARRHSDPEFEACVAVPREARLLIGGVKNLLSGVTTVAHHDRLYRPLLNPDYPTRVVERYGWSHSLYVDGEPNVSRSYRRTPTALPWIIHVAEGLDDEAVNEFDRLEMLGCLGPNTLIVHGIALDRARRMRLEGAGAGLIWCPSSNLRLFGKTADVADLAAHGRVALGTDSRLSGARDLLDELRAAREIGGFDGPMLESLVTRRSAQLLRLADRGTLGVGARADILVLPAEAPLGRAARADVRLVLEGGIVRYGDAQYAREVAQASSCTEVLVDGRAKILDRRVAALLSSAGASEPGLEIPKAIGRAA